MFFKITIFKAHILDVIIRPKSKSNAVWCERHIGLIESPNCVEPNLTKFKQRKNTLKVFQVQISKLKMIHYVNTLFLLLNLRTKGLISR